MNSAPNSKWTIFDTAEALIKQNRKNNNNHNIRIFIALLITALNRNYTVACTYENNLQSLCDISNIQGVPKKNARAMDCKCKTLQNHQQTSKDVDRKMLRETLYSEIIQRHRRSIFALGSFLRMLKTKKSNYNAIKQDGDSE